MDRIDDPARHCAYIRSSVAADISLIPHAAQADTSVFASQSPRDTAANTRLSRTGRAYKEQDRTGLSSFQAHDRQLLDDPLFYLFQSEVILLQYPPRRFQIYLICRRLVPRKIRQKLHIISEKTCLNAVLSLRLQTVQDLAPFFFCLLIHSALLKLQFQLSKIRHFFGVQLIQLFLQMLHLAADRALPIKFLMLFLLRVLGRLVYIQDLQIFIYHILEDLKALFHAVLREGVIFFLI